MKGGEGDFFIIHASAIRLCLILSGVIPRPTGRQAITPLGGAFGERTLQFYSLRLYE